jgi:hypothetical protein
LRWEAAAKQTSELLIQHYLDCNSTCGTIGRVATTLQMAIEAWGAGDPRVSELVSCYNAALDAGKSGGRIDATRPNGLRRELDKMGIPEFMTTSSPHVIRQAPGTSRSALGRMWRSALEGGRLDGGHPRERGAAEMDADMHSVRLHECPVCQEEFSRAVIREHERCCRRIYALEGTPLPPVRQPPAFGARHLGMLKKWGAIYSTYKQEVRMLQGDGRGAGEWQAAYTAVLVRCRQQLFGDYDEHELQNPPDELLLEASAVYAVCYQNAGSTNESFGREAHMGLAFAWNVAGPYLLHLKVRAEASKDHPGAPARLVKGEILHRVLGAGKSRRQLQDVTDLAGEEGGDAKAPAEGEDEIILTPWTRGVTGEGCMQSMHS